MMMMVMQWMMRAWTVEHGEDSKVVRDDWYQLLAALDDSLKGFTGINARKKTTNGPFNG